MSTYMLLCHEVMMNNLIEVGGNSSELTAVLLSWKSILNLHSVGLFPFMSCPPTSHPPTPKVTLFHSHVGEAIPEEYLLELADWAYRKLTYLQSKEVAAFANPKGESGCPQPFASHGP